MRMKICLLVIIECIIVSSLGNSTIIRLSKDINQQNSNISEELDENFSSKFIYNLKFDYKIQDFILDTNKYPYYAILTIGYGGIVLADVSNPKKPEIKFTYSTNGFCKDIYTYNGILFVTAGSDGLLILDIVDGEKIELIYNLKVEGNVQELDFNNYPTFPIVKVFSIVDDKGIITFVNSTNFEIISRLPINQSVTNIIWLSKYILGATIKNHGLLTISTHNLTSPEIIGNLKTGGSAFGFDKHWYIWESTVYIADGLNGLTIVNITDPRNLTIIQNIYTGFNVTDCTFSKWGFYCFITGFKDVIRLYALDRFNPIEIDRLKTKETAMKANSDETNTYAYVATTEGLNIYNIKGPPYVEGIYREWRTKTLTLHEKIVYLTSVIDEISYISLINVTDKSKPILISKIPLMSDYPSKLVINDSKAYVNDDGLTIVNISNPQAPEILSHYPYDRLTYDIEIYGNFAYLSGSDYLEILDVSDPINPQFVSKIKISPRNIALNFPFAYIDSYNRYPLDNEILILDISEEGNPKILNNITVPTSGDIFVENSLLYASDDDRVLIVNISNPLLPNVLANISFPARSVYLRYPYIFTSGGFNGTRNRASDGINILNIKDPRNLKHIGGFAIESVGSDIVADDNYIYILQGSIGMLILDTRDLTLFPSDFTSSTTSSLNTSLTSIISKSQFNSPFFDANAVYLTIPVLLMVFYNKLINKRRLR